jgi:hypothetical protein
VLGFLVSNPLMSAHELVTAFTRLKGIDGSYSERYYIKDMQSAISWAPVSSIKPDRMDLSFDFF